GPLKAETVKGPIELMSHEPEMVRKQLEEVAAKSGRAARWHDSVTAGFDAARSASKPVALFFVDAKPASEVYAKALEDKSLEALFEKIVFVKLDLKKDAAEAGKFKVVSAPALCIVDPSLERPESKPLGLIIGTKTAKDLK